MLLPNTTAMSYGSGPFFQLRAYDAAAANILKGKVHNHKATAIAELFF